MKSLTRYGTYGFMSALIATQLAVYPRLFADTAEKVDRAKVDSKKSGRALRRDLKKAGRKATGQENSYDDVKDEVKDGVSNTRDEVNHQAKKLEKKTR